MAKMSFKNKNHIRERKSLIQRSVQEQFEIFERIKRQKKEGTELVENIEGETAVLCNMVSENYYKYCVGLYGENKYDKFAAEIKIKEFATTHICSKNCTFQNYEKGMTFVYNNKKYKSTGEIYVCSHSGLVHMCGPQNCKHATFTDNREDVICVLTGLYLGSDYVIYGGSVGSSGKGNGDAGEYIGDNEDGGGHGMNTVADQYSIKDESTAYWNSVVEKLMFECPSKVDVIDVYERYNKEKTTEEMKELIEIRYKKREAATKTFNLFIINDKYMNMLKQRYLHNNDVYNNETIPKHYKSCVRQGKKVDPLTITKIYLRDVWPSLYAYKPGLDLVQENKNKAEYYIECMILLWESLEMLEETKQSCYTFESCCVGLLYYLSVGLEVEISELEDGTPCRTSYISPAKRKKFKQHRITVIPKHEKLNLIKIKDVSIMNSDNPRRKKKQIENKKIETKKKERKNNKRKRHGVVVMHDMLRTRMVTTDSTARKSRRNVTHIRSAREKKDNAANQKVPRVKRSKKKNGQPQCIRAIKKINILYGHAIQACDSIDQFIDIFCLHSMIKTQKYS